MMAEYTRRTLPKGDSVSSFAPNDGANQKAVNGRVGRKLCHHKQPKEERPTTLATAGEFVCSITYVRTVLEDLLEKDAVA